MQTPRNVDRAVGLLGVERDACIVLANGFDPDLFAPREVDRTAIWRRTLVQEPQGWRPGADPGSVAYDADQVAVLDEAVTLIAVGRYTAVKRIGLVVEAFARAERRTRRVPALVIVGGFPGEWEGEHPWDAVRRTGARNVFLAGLAGASAFVEPVQRGRRAGPRFGTGAVRPRARRGDGLRPAGDRGRPAWPRRDHR